VKLFGRHIFWCSPGLLRGDTRWALHLAGEAKVSERCLSLGIEEDITGFHISMDKPMAMGSIQSVSNLEHYSDGLSRRQSAATLQNLFKRFMQQRHHEVEKTLSVHTILSGMVDRHEMWMAEGSYPARFRAEALDI
jgi:hypothetical protein